MAELHPSSVETHDSVKAERGIKPRRAWLAFLMSYLLPGLGQLYTGTPGKALKYFGLSFVLSAMLLVLGSDFMLDFGFAGFLAFMIIGQGIGLGIAAEAAYQARKDTSVEARAHDRWWVYLGLLLAWNFTRACAPRKLAKICESRSLIPILLSPIGFHAANPRAG